MLGALGHLTSSSWSPGRCCHRWHATARHGLAQPAHDRDRRAPAQYRHNPAAAPPPTAARSPRRGSGVPPDVENLRSTAAPRTAPVRADLERNEAAGGVRTSCRVSRRRPRPPDRGYIRPSRSVAPASRRAPPCEAGRPAAAGRGRAGGRPRCRGRQQRHRAATAGAGVADNCQVSSSIAPSRLVAIGGDAHATRPRRAPVARRSKVIAGRRSHVGAAVDTLRENVSPALIAGVSAGASAVRRSRVRRSVARVGSKLSDEPAVPGDAVT